MTGKKEKYLSGLVRIKPSRLCYLRRSTEQHPAGVVGEANYTLVSDSACLLVILLGNAHGGSCPPSQLPSRDQCIPGAQ